MGGVTKFLTPREARAESVPFRVLTGEQVARVERLGRAIVPGADQAGLAHFLDQQLAADPGESLLMIRYLDVPPPYVDFYRPALASAERLALAQFGKSLPELGDDQASALVGMMADGEPEDWEGPPAPFFYFVFRADAVDVVYGTVEGFEKLDVPYLGLVEPKTTW